MTTDTLTTRSASIADALATAFGGLSQLTTADVGRAVAGQINNNGLGYFGSVEECCVAVLDEVQRDYCGPWDEWLPVWEVVGECHATLNGYSTL